MTSKSSGTNQFQALVRNFGCLALKLEWNGQLWALVKFEITLPFAIHLFAKNLLKCKVTTTANFIKNFTPNSNCFYFLIIIVKLSLSNWLKLQILVNLYWNLEISIHSVMRKFYMSMHSLTRKFWISIHSVIRRRKKSEIWRKSTYLKLVLKLENILLYGCETWAISKSITKEINSFKQRLTERVLSIFWLRIIKNEEVGLFNESAENIIRRRW